MKRCAYFLVAVFVIGLFSLASASEAVATDIFVKIAGIPGESRDKRHSNWIDAESITHQIEQKVHSIGAAGGRSGGKPDFGDFVVFKKIDKATPALNLYCAKGQHIPEVTIHRTASTTDAGRVPYMEYKLEDVVVTLVRAGIPGGKAGTEEVGLSFGKITWTYTELDVRGKKKGEITYSWDLQANKEANTGQKSTSQSSGQTKPRYVPRQDRKIPPSRTFRPRY
ncbi:MAG: Hcp family type VI secretion system effector [Planctomycetota bacterium]